MKLSFRLRAKYPSRARTFASRIYEYYDPAATSVARPVQLEVAKRQRYLAAAASRRFGTP